ncbi:HlyD family secretion protein [Sphingobium terrigena]|uniref:HlyD family secretion protein n=1 Tax=Sphingobium terrigena TaxID=2304063 RepID=A0A418YYQ7_9SPHN|nr:HlyD family secretion protein [Sphingobium terrigena]RJG58014.1 HlyD family secretion protein [Sphingobium terrigena]
MTDTREPLAPDRETTDAPPSAISTRAEETAPPPDAEPEAPPKTIKPTRNVVLIMALVFVIGTLVVLYAWKLWPFAGDDRRTENAYVRGQITAMAPQVSGYVVEVTVRDFARVKRGQLLMRIDDRIYRQQLDQALAQLKQAQADLTNWQQTVALNQATLRTRVADRGQARAELIRARADLARVSELAARGSVSLRERDQVRATELAAEASVTRAEANIDSQQQTILSTRVSRASLEGKVQQAQAQVDLARINLANTLIRAPRDGQIGEASVRLGQYVAAGSQLMFLVPDELWVVANFKETQIARMRIGQPARFRVDALDDAQLTGRIEQLAPATGSEFSVLRPDNASGNFTKIVQRIPVRIRIDQNQPLAARLRPGMSVVAEVDTADVASPREQER